MKIRYEIGNVCNATQTAIAHGCNAQGVMGSGVARAIREKWPNVYEVYHLRYQTFGLSLGEIIPVRTIDDKLVLNCITQDRYGRDHARYVDYAAVEKVFETINSKVLDWEVAEVAMPKIGAGLGGGDWDVISEIIERTSTNYQPIVYSLEA